MKKLVVTFIGVLVLAGCSEESNQYKSIVQCSISAELLNRDLSWNLIQAHSKIIATNEHFDISPSKTTELRRVIESEWKLDSLSSEARTEKLESVLNSPTCKALQL